MNCIKILKKTTATDSSSLLYEDTFEKANYCGHVYKNYTEWSLETRLITVDDISSELSSLRGIVILVYLTTAADPEIYVVDG